MSTENGAAPAAETPAPAQASSELQPGASPAPADGGAAPEGEGAQPQPAAEGQGETQEEQDKKRQRFDRRFSDLSRAAREAELRAARLEGELNALRSQQRPHQEEPQAAAPAELKAPDPKDFAQGEFDPKYLEALTDYKVDKRLRDRDQAEAERQRFEAANAAIQEGKARLDDTIGQARQIASGEQGEYFQNAAGVLDLAYVPVAQGGLPRHVVDLITESDNPVHVAEYLGRNPDMLRDVRGLNAIQAAKRIGVIDAAIAQSLKRASNGNGASQTPAARPAPTPSPAAIPTAPGAGGAAPFDPNKASPAEYAEARKSGRFS